ncbi:MAG: polyamine aminopropyltransferase [Dehalococcoidia bacterium]|nr:MAG: polyamine aminopropyltransferase [Dehalococcoidia bacterium]
MKKMSANWFWEFVTPHLIQQFSISDIIYNGMTKYQSVQVIDTPGFGKCLILDGKIQCSESDEFIYHEALVHPPMITHPGPETVFIAGGGEGATLREVLAHSSVKRVVMVDIDRQVVDLCRKYLPSLSQGAFEDGRVELLHVDALKYLEDTKENFDVVIIDLTEPLEEGPSYLLYTREFYQGLKDKLTPDGLIALQSGSTSMIIAFGFTAVANTLGTAFSIVAPYQTEIPSFGGTWGFAVASQNLDPRELLPEEVDRRISSRINKDLRFYDGITHRGIFSLPKYLREEMNRDKRIITRDQPLFTY